MIRRLLILAVVALARPPLAGASEGDAPRLLRLEAGRSVSVSSAALLVSGMSGGELAVSAQAVVLPRAAAEAPVLVLLEVDPATLPDSEESLDLEVAVYAFEADGEVAATAMAELHLDALDSPDLEGQDGGLQVRTALSLPAGSYELRAVVLERTTGAVGLASRLLEVSAPGRNRTTAWFLRPAGGWIVGLTDAVALEALRPSSSMAAVRPALRPDDIAYLRLARLSALGGRPEFDGRILAGDGRVVASVSLALASGLAVDPGLRIEDASFVVPELPPGVYGLRLAPAGAPAYEAGTELVFFVPATEGGAAGLGPVAGAEIGSGSPLLPGAAAEYRDLLHSLAAGDLHRAASGLQALEAGVLRQEGSGGLQRLMRAEQALIEHLTRDAPTALPALVPLHAAALEGHHAAPGRAVAEMLTVPTLELLARALTKQVESTDERRAAAAAASAAAAALQRTGWREASDRVFGHAIALDATHHAALLGAAAGRETAGDYRSAVDLLGSLVDVEPGAEEARLRLALNLVRVGEAARGAEVLRGLAPTAESEWISVLAFQELARLEESSGRSEAVLRRGLARWPGEPGLMLQLALLLDPSQSAAATADLLQPLLEAPGSEAAAPRVRYNEWPQSLGEWGETEARRALAGWLETTARQR